jgi:hypothetical protein
LRRHADTPPQLPNFGAVATTPEVTAMIDNARRGGNWGAFLARLSDRLTPAAA